MNPWVRSLRGDTPTSIFQKMLDSSSLALVCVDVSNTILWSNGLASELLGADGSRVPGEPLALFMTTEGGDGDISACLDAFRRNGADLMDVHVSLLNDGAGAELTLQRLDLDGGNVLAVAIAREPAEVGPGAG